MISSIPNAAVAAASIFAALSFPTVKAQANLQQATFQGCYSSSSPLVFNSTYQYQTSGYCQQQCGKWMEKAAFAVSRGSDCYCGDKFPPQSAKVDDNQCNRPCQGFGSENCGGMTTFSVYNSGLLSSVESASDDEASAAATTTGAAATTKGPATTPTLSPATITQAGTTIILSATPAAATTKASSSVSGGGASKAGIAAGVVVGILAIAGIAGGIFFFMRAKKRKAIEEEHQRQNTINGFARTGSKTEVSSADSRLDPNMMYRRQSNGSLADEGDLSRRVLKVTNPDRNTMIA